jgi:hypothetical protein
MRVTLLRMSISRKFTLASLLTLLAVLSQGFLPVPVSAAPVPLQAVTQDGWTLSGDLHLPQGVSNPPVLILVHMYGNDRKDFDGLIPYFLKEGFALLAYDIRGHGGSRRHEKDIVRYQDFKSADDQERMVIDVKAWLDLLSDRPELKGSKFGVLGGSIGGNIAYVSCGAFPKLKAGVALSASYNEKGILIGNSVTEGFDPHNMLFIAGEKDGDAAASARKFQATCSGAHRTEVIKDSSKHGLNLIVVHEEAFRLCVDWFKRHLK